jgi:DNA-binding transcriptional LysR family regulator
MYSKETMHSVDVSNLDLNLLVVLDALLARGSVTGAAAALGLTQPSVSHALGRLREALGDPVLVRAGRGMVRTPRAEALAPVVRRLLGEVRRVFAREAEFDAATSTRAFSIACPDLLVALLPELLGRLAKEAPQVRLSAQPPPADLGALLGDGALDLAVLPARDEGPGLVQRVLGSVHWSILARRGHPAITERGLTRAAWLAHPHVIVRTAEGTGVVGRELGRLQIERRIGFMAPSFLAALHAIAATDWFFAAPRELTADLAEDLDLVMVDPPIALPAQRVAIVWHERMHADLGHRYLRELLADVVGGALSRRPRSAPRARARASPPRARARRG